MVMAMLPTLQTPCRNRLLGRRLQVRSDAHKGGGVILSSDPASQAITACHIKSHYLRLANAGLVTCEGEGEARPPNRDADWSKAFTLWTS
jgi:hypothetical protein